MPPEQDPSGRRTIAPVSMELLSFPLPNFMGGASSLTSSGGGGGGDQGGATTASSDAKRAMRRKYYGVRLRVAGSGWTQPLSVDTFQNGNSNGGGGGGADATLESAQPVLIQAEVRHYGVVYEVIARLEVTQFRNSQVLRLEPHIVITNRTAVPLQILQCRPAGASPAATAAFSQQPGAVVVPEGAASVVPGATRGVNAVPIDGAEEMTPLVRPLLRSITSRSRARTDSAIWQDSDDDESEKATVAAAPAAVPAPRISSSPSKQSWKGMPSMLPAAALVQLPCQQGSKGNDAGPQAGAILDLPVGSVAVPLHLVQGLYRKHVLCFRYGAVNDDDDDGDGGGGSISGQKTPVATPAALFWSRPLPIVSGHEEEHYVAIPVATTGAATAATTSLALLRLSVHSRGPGMLHVVLESVNSDPPFLLENRTPYPLHYRQVRCCCCLNFLY